MRFVIIAFLFYSQFVQCPNFFGIGFVIFLPREINSAFDCESKSYTSFKEDNRVAC